MRTGIIASGLFFVIAAVAAASCGSSSSSGGTGGTSGGTGGTSAGTGGAGTGGAPATFAQVLAILAGDNANCAVCHTGAGTDLPEVQNLTAAGAHASLVNVDAKECTDGRKRVKPGDPDNSYLIDKLKGQDLCSGLQMPYGGTPLPAADIATIESWIRGGALQ